MGAMQDAPELDAPRRTPWLLALGAAAGLALAAASLLSPPNDRSLPPGSVEDDISYCGLATLIGDRGLIGDGVKLRLIFRC